MYVHGNASLDGSETIISPETQQARAFVTSDDQHEQVFTEGSPHDVEAI